jgi:arylsulfatase A-like enzyme
MNRREFIKAIGLGAAALTMSGCAGVAGRIFGKTFVDKPNFIIIFCDDAGYADVGCFGAKGFETPNLDRMAAEGVRFTDFYVAAASCTPSRAALMTGCYPQRVSLPHVLGPKAKIGVNSEEQTIAELLKSRGYATACYGKWHLGHHPEFLPKRHGFDDYFGLPYSNDMWPHHPERPGGYPDLPLVEGERVIEYNPDQTKLTTWYTERAVKFIEANSDRPFFLYVPHSMPHVPLYVSDKFKGKSKQGLYGDVIMEIDWSVGQILSTLKRFGIDEQTLVIFSSDNGPWLSYGDHAGSARPLREGKGTTFDGGQREPCIMRWPGRIPVGTVCEERRAVFCDGRPADADETGRSRVARTAYRWQGHLAADVGPTRGQESARGVVLLPRLGTGGSTQRQMETSPTAQIPHIGGAKGRHRRKTSQIRAGQNRPGAVRLGKRHR